MAICNYTIHIKGKRRSALTFCSTIKRIEQLTIDREQGTDDVYVMHLRGCVKDEADLYGKEIKSIKISNDLLSEEQIRSGVQMDDWINLSLRQKSEQLGLELLVRSYSKDGDFDQLEHYRNGFFVGVIRDTYNENNKFDFLF